jgi:hypothetical protein
MKLVTACLSATLLLAAPHAHADDDDPGSTLRLELGGAGEWSLQDHEYRRGPGAALEFEGLEGLEIEAGTAPLRRNGRTEWNTDLMLKKEYALGRRFEFDAGLGPEWNHVGGKSGSDSAGVEVEAEVIYWPGEQHRFGAYLEPGYSYGFGAEHEQSLSLGAGLAILIR